MATIYRTKPCKASTDMIFISFVRSGLTFNYAQMIAQAKIDTRSPHQVEAGVSYGVLDKDVTRDEFYRSIGAISPFNVISNN